MKLMRTLGFISVFAALSGCGGEPEAVVQEQAADLLNGALQVMTVTTENWSSTTGVLRTFERNSPSEPWVQRPLEMNVTIGRSGMAWGIGLHPVQTGTQKREGDGKAPAGVFGIGTAFGYAQSLTTALDYLALNANHVCVDDGNSPLYNRLVDKTTVRPQELGRSQEKMRRDIYNGDNLYKFGFVISHNPAPTAGRGSCIFFHLWRNASSPTAGCTAAAEGKASQLLAWLNRSKNPRIVQLPASVYQEKKAAWGLPQISGWR